MPLLSFNRNLFYSKPLTPSRDNIVIFYRGKFGKCQPKGLTMINTVSHFILVTSNDITRIVFLYHFGNLSRPAIHHQSINFWRLLLDAIEPLKVALSAHIARMAYGIFFGRGYHIYVI